jgi:hypothetical protein
MRDSGLYRRIIYPLTQRLYKVYRSVNIPYMII